MHYYSINPWSFYKYSNNSPVPNLDLFGKDYDLCTLLNAHNTQYRIGDEDFLPRDLQTIRIFDTQISKQGLEILLDYPYYFRYVNRIQIHGCYFVGEELHGILNPGLPKERLGAWGKLSKLLRPFGWRVSQIYSEYRI